MILCSLLCRRLLSKIWISQLLDLRLFWTQGTQSVLFLLSSISGPSSLKKSKAELSGKSFEELLKGWSETISQMNRGFRKKMMVGHEFAFLFIKPTVFWLYHFLFMASVTSPTQSPSPEFCLSFYKHFQLLFPYWLSFFPVCYLYYLNPLTNSLRSLKL